MATQVPFLLQPHQNSTCPPSTPSHPYPFITSCLNCLHFPSLNTSYLLYSLYSLPFLGLILILAALHLCSSSSYSTIIELGPLAPRYPFHLIPVLSLPLFSHLRRLLLLYLPLLISTSPAKPRRRPLSLVVVYAAVKDRHVVARDRREKEKEGDRTSVNDQSQSTAILVPYSCPPLCSFLETTTTQQPAQGIYDFDPELPFTPSQTRFGMSNSLSLSRSILSPNSYYPTSYCDYLNYTAPVAEDSTLPTYQASIPS